MTLKHKLRAGSRRRVLAGIIAAGCLGTVWGVSISSPATTDFYRKLGANEFHFGLLASISLLTLVLQFVGALCAGFVSSPKRFILTVAALSRLSFLIIGVLPLIFPGRVSGQLVPLILILVAVQAGLSNLINPMWSSWLVDTVPKSVISRFWGGRHRWTQFVTVVAFLLIALYTHSTTAPIERTFLILLVIGTAAGLLDILMFARFPPPIRHAPAKVSLVETLIAPLRDPQYRTFIAYSCTWSAMAMIAAPFMMLYVLKELNVPLWQTTLIWCMCGIGQMLAARTWGRIADRIGSRPILHLCISLKPVIVFVFIILTPGNVLYLLPATFLFDNLLNAGLAVATNGYMMRYAPAENRSVYIAAITGLSGLCGAAAAAAGGALLQALSGVQFEWLGRTWNHYHILFVVGIFARLLCLPVERRLQEPGAGPSSELYAILADTWPIRLLGMPLGLLRRISATVSSVSRNRGD